MVLALHGSIATLGRGAFFCEGEPVIDTPRQSIETGEWWYRGKWHPTFPRREIDNYNDRRDQHEHDAAKERRENEGAR